MIPRAKIYKGGKIVIPAFLRKKLNLKEGEEVTFTVQDDNLIMTSLKHTLEKARQTINRYHPSNESLVEKLITARCQGRIVCVQSTDHMLGEYDFSEEKRKDSVGILTLKMAA